jgi:hypothetical protein
MPHRQLRQNLSRQTTGIARLRLLSKFIDFRVKSIAPMGLGEPKDLVQPRQIDKSYGAAEHSAISIGTICSALSETR